MAKGQRRDLEREEFWRDVLARFGTSGLNVRTFCARERLSEPSFYAWRRTLRERHAQQSRPAFVPLVVGDAAVSLSQLPGPPEPPERGIVIELHVPACGPRPLVLRLPVALPIGQVAQLVHAIAAGPDDEPRKAEVQP
jgi:hypothetical protein